MAYTNIDDPSAYFQTALYTGNNTANHAITNDGNSDLQPDLLWIKSRDATHSHWLVDSNRGVTKGFFVETSDAERTSLATRDVASFDTDGFTVGVPYQSSSTNSNASTKVAWQWKANGGTTSSNTDGSVTSTVQANTTAGFSIVTYSSDNTSSETIGHGLGAEPQVVLVKRRNSANRDWSMYHKSLGNTQYIQLNENFAAVTSSAWWNDTSPTSSVFSIGTGNNSRVNSSSQIAYCFAEKQGYSKIGSYVGNGNANGPFIYTGFKPAFVMIKNASATTNWYMWDNKRNTYNVVNNGLNPNISKATQGTSYDSLDFLSNGFKIRDYAYGTWNGSGNTIIYMAFAENPFVTSTGIPTTAR